MKITFIINSLKDKSGTERVACLLANLFVERLGHQVSIINRDTSYENVSYPINKQVEVIPLSGNLLGFYKKTQKKITSQQPDCIIIHNMGKLSLLCSLLSKKNSRIISVEHVAFPSRLWYVKLLSKVLYKKYDKVVTLSYKDSTFYKKEKTCVIHNISPFEKMEGREYDTDSKTIVSIGRLTYQKNFEALIKAWSRIEGDLPQWKMEIYGKGEDYHMLKENIQQLNIKRLFLKGESKNVSQVYQNASFYVLSSRFEGLPMVLIEAQSYALPIVSFDCPYGPSEVVKHSENGLLVENQNINQLAEAIKLLAKSPERRQLYSQKAKEHSIKFSSENILKQWEKLLKSN